jgi:hypothetical protein
VFARLAEVEGNDCFVNNAAGVAKIKRLTKRSANVPVHQPGEASRSKRSPGWLRSRKEAIWRMRRGTPRRSEKNCLLTKRSANLVNACLVAEGDII